jgi:WD40 repeat protein
VGGPTTCASFTVGTTLTLAPAAPGQAYVRCGTLGPEQAWTVAPSPSGDRLAAITAAGTVRLISTSSWTEIAQLASPVGELDAVAFSPDGARLATLSSEMGEVTLWDAQTGALQTSFAGPPASTLDAFASSLAFSPDGRKLATSLGTVIDLTTGTRTSWRTGAPDTTVLKPNPENLTAVDAGGAALIRFTAGDARLFVVTRYQIGNSPTSIRLELRDPATGAQTVLFDAYERALLGYAISDDGRYISRGATEEAGTGAAYGPGLYVVDATTGTQVAGDATATSTAVLGFSHDGAQLFTQTGGTVATRETIDLHVIATAPWTTGTTFLAVSPQDDLVASAGGATSYIDPASGAVLRTLPFALTTVRWTADGRFAVGSGDPGALFHFWAESAGTQLCAPAAQPGSGPAIASLGTPMPPNGNGTGSVSATSVAGTVTETETFVLHSHATNLYADTLTATATGALLRQFGAFPSGLVTGPFLALSVPSGDQAFTPAYLPFHAAGPDVAVWCR